MLDVEDETLVDEFIGVEEPNEVTVCVVRCRKLQRTSRTLALKDSSCPFVKVRTKFEEKKTRTLRKTVHPQYMKRFAFEMRAGDDDLLVETWDGSERDGDDPLFMGRARILLRALDDRVPHRMWLTLGDAKGKHDADKGRGQVEVVAWHHYNPRHHCDVPGDTRDDAVPDGPCNQICVSVLRAWNLTALDHKSASSGFAGSSDPFCVVHCNGQDKTTQTIDADVHPVWLATFKFLASPKNDVRFDVWDYDSLRSNKFIGTAAFPLGDVPFEKGRPRRLWLKLTNRDGFKDKRRGMVEIFVHWHTSMKLYKEEEIDDVAHLTEDGSVLDAVRARRVRQEDVAPREHVGLVDAVDVRRAGDGQVEVRRVFNVDLRLDLLAEDLLGALVGAGGPRRHHVRPRRRRGADAHQHAEGQHRASASGRRGSGCASSVGRSGASGAPAARGGRAPREALWQL